MSERKRIQIQFNPELYKQFKQHAEQRGFQTDSLLDAAMRTVQMLPPAAQAKLIQAQTDAERRTALMDAAAYWVQYFK